MTRYLVIKGWSGLADRLQVLSFGLRYALLYDRTIVVDWSDEQWTHDGNACAFYKYFKLTNISYIDQLPHSQVSIFPPVWKRIGLQTQLSREIVLKHFTDMDITEKDVTLSTDYLHTIVVFSNVGAAYRLSIPELLVKHVQPREWIQKMFNSALKTRQIVMHESLIIHVRGRDRALHNTGEHTQIFLNLYRKIEEIQKQKENVNVLLITDDDFICQKWLAPYRKWRGAIENPQINPSQGIHQISPTELEQSGTTKEELNTSAILDFLLLMNARIALSTQPDSYYFVLARELHALSNADWCKTF